MLLRTCARSIGAPRHPHVISSSLSDLPPVNEEAQGSQGGAPACSPLLLTAHASPLLTAHRCQISQLQLTACTAHSACYPLMCALLPLTATSHCLQEEKKKTNKAAAGKREEGKAEPKEEVKKQAPQSKADGKKAEGKKAEATVVPQPLDGDGNPVDTEECTVTFIEEQPAGPRKRSKRVVAD